MPEVWGIDKMIANSHRPITFTPMPDPTTKCGHIALAGAPNVGKSALLNTLVGSHLAIVSAKAQSTRLPVTGLRTDGTTQYIFHDLPGLMDPRYALQERMRAAALETLDRADVILHLHPAPEAPAPAFETVARLDTPPRAPVRQVYTKADLVPAPRRKALADGASVTSATTGEGIDALLTWLDRMLPTRPFAFDPEDLATQPLRFFVVEYLREAAFELLSDEVPYAFTAEVEEFRESERPIYIRVHLFVERDSQKGILIGQGGQTIKAIGQRARTQLETLLDAPVYLDCWVKVLPKWRRNAAALTRFGFPETKEPR